jgi:hypothetical protein
MFVETARQARSLSSRFCLELLVQPHAWAAAVLIDEYHSSALQRPANGEFIGDRRRGPLLGNFGMFDGIHAQHRLAGEIGRAPHEKMRAALIWALENKAILLDLEPAWAASPVLPIVRKCRALLRRDLRDARIERRGTPLRCETADRSFLPQLHGLQVHGFAKMLVP